MLENSYLISGANGYIASNIIKLIKQNEPNSKVFALIRKNSLLKQELIGFVDRTFHWDGEKIIESNYLDEVNIVLHLATNFKKNIFSLQERDVIGLMEDNIYFGYKLLQDVKRNKSNIKFINFASWTSSIGTNQKYLNFYSATKGLFEKLIVEDSNQYKNQINIRLPETYGPNDDRNKVYSLIANSTVDKLNSSKEQILVFVHVNDIYRFISYIIQNDIRNKSYDLFPDENKITLEELVKYLEKNISFGDSLSPSYPTKKNLLPVDFKVKYSIKNIKNQI